LGEEDIVQTHKERKMSWLEDTYGDRGA